MAARYSATLWFPFAKKSGVAEYLAAAVQIRRAPRYCLELKLERGKSIHIKCAEVAWKVFDSAPSHPRRLCREPALSNCLPYRRAYVRGC